MWLKALAGAASGTALFIVFLALMWRFAQTFGEAPALPVVTAPKLGPYRAAAPVTADGPRVHFFRSNGDVVVSDENGLLVPVAAPCCHRPAPKKPPPPPRSVQG